MLIVAVNQGFSLLVKDKTFFSYLTKMLKKIKLAKIMREKAINNDFVLFVGNRVKRCVKTDTDRIK